MSVYICSVCGTVDTGELRLVTEPDAVIDVSQLRAYLRYLRTRGGQDFSDGWNSALGRVADICGIDMEGNE